MIWIHVTVQLFQTLNHGSMGHETFDDDDVYDDDSDGFLPTRIHDIDVTHIVSAAVVGMSQRDPTLFASLAQTLPSDKAAQLNTACSLASAAAQ